MSKKPAKNTTTRQPVASGRSPIVPARGVALRVSEDGTHPVAERHEPANTGGVQGAAPTLSDTVARPRARDHIEIPTNPKLEQARADLDAAVAAKALTNWEVAMVESLIDLRDLQDVIDAMTAKQEIIRENVKLALAGSEAKTFKFNLGAATLAKGAETVTIIDAKKIPYEFMTSVPDKAKISRALKVPVDVAGATLTEGKPSLRVTWEE
jgi:hypothetical protein